MVYMNKKLYSQLCDFLALQSTNNIISQLQQLETVNEYLDFVS